MNLRSEISKILLNPLNSFQDGKCPYCDYQCTTRGKTNGVTQHIFYKHHEKRNTKVLVILALIKKHERAVIGEIEKELIRKNDNGNYIYTHSATFLDYLAKLKDSNGPKEVEKCKDSQCYLVSIDHKTSDPRCESFVLPTPKPKLKEVEK